MFYFNFENELNSVLRMDGFIIKGLGMRFERKVECNQSVNSFFNISITAKISMKNFNRLVNNLKTLLNVKIFKFLSNVYNLINNDYLRYYKLKNFFCYVFFYFMYILFIIFQ